MKNLSRYSGRRSSALVLILICVSLLTIIVVSLLTATSYESSVSQASFQSAASNTLAQTGVYSAVARIRTALGPWDNPYSNFCNPANPAPTNMWTMSPGLITLWSYSDDSFADAVKYPLFSQSNNGDTNMADLNKPTSAGFTPILPQISGTNMPLQVAWCDVLQNPRVAAGPSNRIIGRYAWWVDDESAKININTADGTMKYQTNSLGLGTPSEVSLQVLQQGGADLDTDTATNIVYLARTTGFNSPQEILRAPGTTPDLYTNNTWNITCTSRSPDLNMFGQPKMAIIECLGGSWTGDTDIELNGITMQPLTEIYPTPSQLPSYTVTNLYPNPTAYGYPAQANVPWPLVFRGSNPQFAGWGFYGGISPGNTLGESITANYMYINGAMISHYLAGMDAFNRPITWPPFTGATTATSFFQKYSYRQIDSITAQVVSLGSRLLSADRCYNNDDGPVPIGQFGLSAAPTLIDPPIFTGWLSHQWVNGLGRTPKVTSAAVEFARTSAQGTLPAPLTPLDSPTNYANYTAPALEMCVWMQWWMPPQYLSGAPIPAGELGNVQSTSVGTALWPSLNSVDESQTVEDWRYSDYDLSDGAGAQAQPIPQYTWMPGGLPLSDSFFNTAPNFWADVLMTATIPGGALAGVDFQNNPNSRLDPELLSPTVTNVTTTNSAAAFFHPYCVQTNWNDGSTTTNVTLPSPPTTNIIAGNPPITNITPGVPGSTNIVEAGVHQYGWSGASEAGSSTNANWDNLFASPMAVTWLMNSYHGDWSPGEIRIQNSRYDCFNDGSVSAPMRMADYTRDVQVVIKGGLQVRTYSCGDSYSDLDIVPLEAVRGNPDYLYNWSVAPAIWSSANIPDQTMSPQAIRQGSRAQMAQNYDYEGWTNTASTPGGMPMPGDSSDTTVFQRQTNAVIPINAVVPATAEGSISSTPIYSLSVLNNPAHPSYAGDPLVNKFPGDWINSYSSVPPDDNVIDINGYDGGLAVCYSGSTTGTSPTGYQATLQDPDAFWLPQLDSHCSTTSDAELASNTIIPRQARMPNVGYLNYLRTGIIPDDETNTAYVNQHGTPYRLLSFAPSDTGIDSTDQKTSFSHSQIYPDWAMLDLFYVPFFLNSYGSPYGFYDLDTTTWNSSQVGGNPSVLAHYSTYGGSTPGRINPNGSVLYTTSVDQPLAGVVRNLPLEAVLQNIWVNGTLVQPTLTLGGPGTGDYLEQTDASSVINPALQGSLKTTTYIITDSANTPPANTTYIPPAQVAQDISGYITTNGPMRIPGEICNVPGVAGLRPGGDPATGEAASLPDPYRNDLVRSIVGELTTQSNVFSIWTVGQSLQKAPGNTNYGQFQSGDRILSETRLHYIVERYLDPGTDGVYGNPNNEGASTNVGTYQAAMDPNLHPMYPAYLYRVLSVEQVQ